MNAILNKNCSSLEGCRIYTTLFPCNETWTTQRMSWSVAVARQEGGEAEHCVAWGADPDNFPACEHWTVPR